MSISFTGLGSGMDYSTWVEQLVAVKMQSVKNLETQQKNLNTRKSAFDTIKSNFNSVRNSLQTVADSSYGGTMDLFASNSVTSSNNKFVTATVTNNASRQDLSIFVKQLATTTTATSTNTLGKSISNETVFSKLANGNARTGSFSLYVDNKKHEIEINSEDTLEDIKNKLEEIENVEVTIEDGKFSIKSDKSLSLGSNADKSNFATVLGLTTYSPETKSYTSNHTITELKDGTRFLDENSGFSEGVTAGTFKIGGATFEINENTTLKSLISEINNSTEAGVKATFDYTSGKLILNSKTTGSMNINIEAGTSNITDILGFTNNGKLVDGSQTAGQNAQISINGTDVTSFSNTITSDVTGLTGVTLNLTAAMSASDENTTISIKQDTDKIVDAIKKIVSDMNTAIANVDTVTATSEDSQGILAFESQLTNLKNTMRSTMLERQQLSDGTFASLSVIGISSGAVGAGVGADTNQLVVDEKALKEALESNPEMVKELLIGKDNTQKNGAVNKVLNQVSSSLDSRGYFATKASSIDNEISSISEKITQKTEQAEAYREKLLKQFQAMDSAIAKLQEQYSSINFT
ncbi:flagellar filament capping protein FliD [bacterium]|nr:flagellar filament capping protein FliD [bacterium]